MEMQPNSALVIGPSVSGLHITGSKANWCHCWFPVCTLFSAHWLVHPLKKSLSFLHKCLIYLCSTLRVNEKNQISICPLRMPCFHWIGPKPILSFLLKVVKGIFPLFLKHHLHLHWSTKKEFCFDLGSNGYQMNISLTCFAAEGRTTFFYLVIQSWFFSVSLTLSPPHASKVELEKQELIISFFFFFLHATVELFAKKVFLGFWGGMKMP